MHESAYSSFSAAYIYVGSDTYPENREAPFSEIASDCTSRPYKLKTYTSPWRKLIHHGIKPPSLIVAHENFREVTFGSAKMIAIAAQVKIMREESRRSIRNG
jgi:hypothetical protein